MSDHNPDTNPIGLPENAYRELNPGEQYEPVMLPEKEYPEVNFYPVISFNYFVN